MEPSKETQALLDSFAARSDENARERFETIVIGGGQAGLSTGYHLAKQGLPCLILDANERVGDAWRKRWDSLRLFTPAKYDGLDGMPFPAPPLTLPTKDEMADYLESYATHFGLPVRTGVRVDRLTRQGDCFLITAGDSQFEAKQVVVASGAHQIPKVPDFAGELDPKIVQIHSSQYRSPSQLREGDVLIVGVGNSGAEIANEVCRTHHVWLSGKPSGQLPGRPGPTTARFVLPIVRFLGHHVLTKGTPIGRKVGPKLATRAAPLIRIKLKDLAAAGVEQVARTIGVKEGKPVLEDGRTIDVANVIWCTGFREEFRWIDLPIFGEDGRPVHERGVVTKEPGLYFMGLIFQYAESSDVLPGVGRDAKYVARAIAARMKARDGGPEGQSVRLPATNG
jgi:putative flavoprotein involved in K+ transport